MLYKGPGGFNRIMNIVMNFFMCLTFSFIMLWIAQQRAGDMAQVLTPLNYLISFLTAYGIGYVVTDLIPVFRIGDAAAKKLGSKGLLGYIVTVLVLDVIITTILSFLMTMINMVDRAGVMGAFMSWISMYPMMLLVGFVVQFIVMKPAMALAKKVTGFDPENPMAGMPGGMMPPAGVGVGAPGVQAAQSRRTDGSGKPDDRPSSNDYEKPTE